MVFKKNKKIELFAQLSQVVIHNKAFHCLYSYKQFSCLKRENANHCAINYTNKIKNSFVCVFSFLCI